jgi:hypothetical protein
MRDISEVMTCIYAFFILENLILRKSLHSHKAAHIRARLQHDDAFLFRWRVSPPELLDFSIAPTQTADEQAPRHTTSGRR